MAALLTTIGLIFTEALVWCGAVVTMIVKPGNEILLLFAVIGLVGLGIGIYQRLIRG